MTAPTAVNSLTIEIERKGDHAIVHCRGRLVAGVGNLLSTRVHELIPHCKCITLDLTDLTYVDSMGLGLLVRLYVSAKSGGSRIELINLAKQIRELLGLTNLLSLFGDMCEKGVAMKF